MHILSSAQVRQIEQKSINYGLTDALLIENAGCAAAAYIDKIIKVEGLKCVVFCGRGNNGGDGFVVARRLKQFGAEVFVVLTDGKPKTPAAERMLIKLSNVKIEVIDFEDHVEAVETLVRHADVIVDAIFGTGFQEPLSGKHRKINTIINSAISAVFSLDLPTGVNCDTGICDDDSVVADYTIAFGCLKPAHLLSSAQKFCQFVDIVEIGLPSEAYEGYSNCLELSSKSHVFSLLQPRSLTAHKGDFGRLLNIAGSPQYPGAALLSTASALKSGAGYVTLASSDKICGIVAPAVPQAVHMPLAVTAEGHLSRSNIDVLISAASKHSAVAVGCGLGQNDHIDDIVFSIIERATVPIILDADGINSVARNINVLSRASVPIVMTPHPGELARLINRDVSYVTRNTMPLALYFADRYNVTLVIKASKSLIATRNQPLFVNATGNPGLAKAGSGDVLTGIIGAFLAQGLSQHDAAVAGVYIHGRAADIAVETKSQYALLAQDVIDSISRVFLENDR